MKQINEQKQQGDSRYTVFVKRGKVRVHNSASMGITAHGDAISWYIFKLSISLKSAQPKLKYISHYILVLSHMSCHKYAQRAF